MELPKHYITLSKTRTTTTNEQTKTGQLRHFEFRVSQGVYTKQGVGSSSLTCLELLFTKKSYSHGRGMEKANQIRAVQKSQQMRESQGN